MESPGEEREISLRGNGGEESEGLGGGSQDDGDLRRDAQAPGGLWSGMVGKNENFLGHQVRCGLEYSAVVVVAAVCAVNQSWMGKVIASRVSQSAEAVTARLMTSWFWFRYLLRDP